MEVLLLTGMIADMHMNMHMHTCRRLREPSSPRCTRWIMPLMPTPPTRAKRVGYCV